MQKRKRIARKQVHERVQENRLEFGRASAANKLFRAAFREILPGVADRYISGRLTKRIMRIIQCDPVGERGERTLTADMLPMLEGFNFNRQRILSDTLYAPYTVSFDRATGLAAIHIPVFNPAAMVDTRSKTDRYELVGCAAMIDFAGRETAFVQQYTPFMYFNDSTTTSVYLQLPLPVGTSHPVIITLGVLFADDKVFNAMAVVKVMV